MLPGLYVPDPPLQLAEEAAPPIEPDKVTEPLLQIVWSGPAFTAGSGFTLTVVLCELEQPVVAFVAVTV